MLVAFIAVRSTLNEHLLNVPYKGRSRSQKSQLAPSKLRFALDERVVRDLEDQTLPSLRHAAARQQQGVAALAQVKQDCASLEDRDVFVDQPRHLAEGLVCECSAFRLLNGTLSSR
jgi:hypothetical protein